MHEGFKTLNAIFAKDNTEEDGGGTQGIAEIEKKEKEKKQKEQEERKKQISLQVPLSLIIEESLSILVLLATNLIKS